MSRDLLRLTLLLMFPFFIVSQSQLSFAQATHSDLVGPWLKEGSGHRLDFRKNGEVQVTFGGETSAFNDLAQASDCPTKAGANLCISAQRFNCAFRFSLSGNALNLQFRTGKPDYACKEASGDYRRRD